jgi:hypothetical protein
MSDINNAAHPEWRQLCRAALLETNPVRLLQRIAHNAVLNRIEGDFSKPPTSEQTALRDTLATLDSFRKNYGATKWLSVKG